MVCPSPRPPSKSRLASPFSSLRGWSFALTPELRKHTTTKIATHSDQTSPLSTLDLLDLASETVKSLTECPSSDLPLLPPLVMKNRVTRKTLMLVLVSWFGPSPIFICSPSRPLANLKSITIFIGVSSYYLRPRFVLNSILPSAILVKSLSFMEGSGRLLETVVMDLDWTWLNLSRNLVASLARLVHLLNDASLILNFLGLTPLLKCLLPVSSSEIFMSSTISIIPFNSSLVGRGLHTNRVTVSLDWIDRYFCQDQILSLLWNLSDALIPNLCQSPKRVKTNGIMIPSLQSGDYRSFCNSLSPHLPIIKVNQMIIYMDNVQTLESPEKNGIMTSSPRRSYRVFSYPFNPSGSSVEHRLKGSYTLLARIIYDHTLVEDFAKLVFMVESAKVSTDFSNFFGKLMKSLSLLPCIFLASICMNFPLVRFK